MAEFEYESTPSEAIKRIKAYGSYIASSFVTKLCLQNLAAEHEMLQLKLAAAEQALSGYKTAYQMLKALPELNMASFVESDVQKLNDGVCTICCEMDTIKDEYDKSMAAVNPCMAIPSPPLSDYGRKI